MAAGKSATPVTTISVFPAHTINKLNPMTARKGTEYKAMPIVCVRSLAFMMRVSSTSFVSLSYSSDLMAYTTIAVTMAVLVFMLFLIASPQTCGAPQLVTRPR